MAQPQTSSAPVPERSRRKRTASVLELLLTAVMIAAATFAVTQNHYLEELRKASVFSVPAQRELSPLVERYGEEHYSRRSEELIVRDFFQDRREGVFLDVGANHYRDESNTYFLETVLGWSGVAVDALSEFGPDYERYRPKTRFVAAFASDAGDGTVTFFVPRNNKLVASANREFTERMKSPGEAQQVPTATLNEILEQAGIERIDFLSMDIELAEPEALAGFAVEKYKPSFVCIEAHPDVRQQILDYFTAHQYVLVGKYLRMDSENLYFEPLPQARLRH
jgi:FkbM family methyltransferase